MVISTQLLLQQHPLLLTMWLLLILIVAHIFLFSPLLLQLNFLDLFLTCRETTRVAQSVFVLGDSQLTHRFKLARWLLMRIQWLYKLHRLVRGRRIVKRFGVIVFPDAADILIDVSFCHHHLDSLCFCLVLVGAVLGFLVAYGWRHVDGVAGEHAAAQLRVIVVLLVAHYGRRIHNIVVFH